METGKFVCMCAVERLQCGKCKQCENFRIFVLGGEQSKTAKQITMPKM